jgi:hypothetical protein
MTMALTQFQFTVLGDSRTGVLDEMDRLEHLILDRAGGEPWLSTSDDITKVRIEGIPLNHQKAFMYKGIKECVFVGPQVIESNPYMDGFRPQKDEDDDGEY